jgi:HEAT repeat protein
MATAAAKIGTPLRSADPATRIAAAKTLESLAMVRKAIKNSGVPGEPPPVDPFAGGWKFIGESATAGMKDANPNVRLAMVEAIESLGDAIEARALMREATRDRVVFVRWAAARALGESAPDKPDATVYAPEIDSLARLLDDTDPDVRTAAINALGKFGPAAKSAAPKLLETVTKGDIEPRVAAVAALGAVGSDAATTVPILITGLQNRDLRLRRASAQGLVRFGAAAKSALPELRKALADPDADLRLAAAEAVLAIELKRRFKEL